MNISETNQRLPFTIRTASDDLNEGSTMIDDKFAPLPHEDILLLNVSPLHPAKPKTKHVCKIDPSLLLRRAPPQEQTVKINADPRQRQRSVSESEVNNSRRSIFGVYLKKQTINQAIGNEEAPGVDTPQLTRKRPPSMSILDSVEPKDFRIFKPPQEHTSPILDRFDSIEDLSIASMESLPPLPSPLRRLRSEGSSRCLSGMYPLVTPVPILRQSTFGSLNRTLSDPTKKVLGLQYSFNLTQSLHTSGETDSHDLEVCSSSNSDTPCSIRFDPRVTVTEFEDNVVRQWYNEAELEICKHETVELAKEYLIAHPHEAERYNLARLDQVTGTYRKKALFSLPILASTVDEILPKVESHEYHLLLECQVKSILIVDPNNAILNLFCKSLHQLFPSASLTTSQCGEEALRMAEAMLQRGDGTSSQPRGFDIIVVEQRLYRTQKNGGSCQTGLSQNVCGSELIRAICEVESKVFSSSSNHQSLPARVEASALSPRSVQWKSLVIGVSAQPDRDAESLQKSGADVIWKKPIPSVGEALRNQLLSALVSKRRRYKATE
jgi:hypothetical protein